MNLKILEFGMRNVKDNINTVLWRRTDDGATQLFSISKGLLFRLERDMGEAEGELVI